ncbi:hypothetical protein H5410_020099 [Solanum commersonii]|uniref:Uncharacterized protein n=1 Tax=Solanum commersonii TaxID=4109 RepID=A0A9J5Z843_SOLCO|nr:hypothetical protein H5410_020099 [Solanum commersonii]
MILKSIIPFVPNIAIEVMLRKKKLIRIVIDTHGGGEGTVPTQPWRPPEKLPEILQLRREMQMELIGRKRFAKEGEALWRGVLADKYGEMEGDGEQMRSRCPSVFWTTKGDKRRQGAVEVNSKIKSMKELYFSKLNDLYQKMAYKVQ